MRSTEVIVRIFVFLRSEM